MKKAISTVRGVEPGRLDPIRRSPMVRGLVASALILALVGGAVPARISAAMSGRHVCWRHLTAITSKVKRQRVYWGCGVAWASAHYKYNEALQCPSVYDAEVLKTETDLEGQEFRTIRIWSCPRCSDACPDIKRYEDP